MAIKTIYYRFTCNQCQKTTDWIPYKIRGATEIDEWKKLDRMKTHVGSGFYFESPFSEKTEYSYSLENKCPFCGTYQKSKKGGKWMAFAYGMGFTTIFGVLFWLMIEIGAIPESRMDLFGVIGLTLFVLGFLYGVKKQAQKYKGQTNENLNKPEYIWEQNITNPNVAQVTPDSIKNASTETIHGLCKLITDPVLSNLIHLQIDTADMILRFASDRVSWENCKSLYSAIAAFSNNSFEAKWHSDAVVKATKLLPILVELEREKRNKNDTSNVVIIGSGGSLKIHHGRSCGQCGATSSELVKRNNGMWDGLRFCPKCKKYFCARCQIDNYHECCPLCNERLINQA